MPILSKENHLYRNKALHGIFRIAEKRFVPNRKFICPSFNYYYIGHKWVYKFDNNVLNLKEFCSKMLL